MDQAYYFVKHIFVSSNLLCQTIYSVHTFNMHLFNFLLSTCWCRSMLCPTLHVLVSSDVHYHGSHARSSLCFFSSEKWMFSYSILICSFRPRHTNRFSVDVNVAAESKVTFNLTYQELLERVYGEYEHIIYIDPGQIIEDFQIDVSIEESKEITKVSVPPLRNDIIQDHSITG